MRRCNLRRPPPGANFGFYGPATTAAVARFQQDFNTGSTLGIWDAKSGQALRARVSAAGNQPVGPSLASVRGADVYQPPRGLPQQGFGNLRPQPPSLSQLAPPTQSLSPGSQPLPGQMGGPTAAQSNAAAQPGPYNFTGATATLTPALQSLFAQTGNAQSSIPISPPSGYKYPDLGTISGQAYSRLAPSEQSQYASYQNQISGKPLADVTGDLNKLSPQGSGLSAPTTFLAHGGLLPEPVLGKGLATGKNYLMGEAGPERVSPVKRSRAASRGPQFHPSLVPMRSVRPGIVQRGLLPSGA